DSHPELRWAVRRQMVQRMLQPPPAPRRPQKRAARNAYAVPTLKKRESLRFNVRRDLARCLMPRRY
ncbi:HYLS1 protein, partial [Mohoua ochrocephala]|nr:HYLS1 protein [Mohoua ochrocephala]